MTTSKTKEFKQTEIGEIPTGWQPRALGELCSLKKEQIDPSDAGNARYVGLEHLDPGNSRIRRWGTERGLRSAKNKFASGDILYGKLRPYLDKSAVASWPGICSTDILVLSALKDECVSDYLGFLLHTSAFIAHAKATTKGVNHPRTSWEDLKRFKSAVPLKPEQERIASALSKVQQVAANQERIVSDQRALKAATIAKLLREGLHGEPLKNTEIGEMPRSWQIKNLTASCEKPQYGYTESSSEKPIGPKFLRITDLTENGVDWGTVPYCKCSENDVIKHQLKAGDILVARIGATTGKNHLIVDCPKAVFASYLIRLRAKPGLVPEFLSNFMDSDIYWKQVRATKGQNLKGGMSGAVLSQILMPFPGEPEQKEISNAITVIDKNIRCAVEKHLHAKLLFSSALNQLMTGKMRILK